MVQWWVMCAQLYAVVFRCLYVVVWLKYNLSVIWCTWFIVTLEWRICCVIYRADHKELSVSPQYPNSTNTDNIHPLFLPRIRIFFFGGCYRLLCMSQTFITESSQIYSDYRNLTSEFVIFGRWATDNIPAVCCVKTNGAFFCWFELMPERMWNETQTDEKS